jgi:PAS domain S-box-containing protein
MPQVRANATTGHWFTTADERAVADLWRVYETSRPRRPLAAWSKPVEDPAATRARLGTAVLDADWATYEANVRRHARTCFDLGIAIERLEQAYAGIALDLAGRLTQAYGASPHRMLAALSALGRLVKAELTVLRDVYSKVDPDEARPSNKAPDQGAPAGNGEPVLAVLGDGVISTDTEGRILQLNPAAEQLLGWTLDEARGRHLDEVFRLVDVESGAAVQSRVDEVVARGVVRGVPTYPLLLSRSGMPRCAVADSIAPVSGPGGAIAGAVLVFRDQDEERAHGEQLEASEARLRAVVEASLDAVVGMDSDENVTEFSGAAERMFGVDRDDVIGKRFAEAFLPEARRAHYAEVVANELHDHGSVRATRYETRAIHQDGSEFPVEMAMVRIPGAGAGTFTCVIRDLTAAKSAERALRESSDQLRELAARVQAAREDERTRIARERHDELGQQLTAIRMDLGWLSRRIDLTGESRERVDAMTALVDTTFKVVRRLGTELRPGVLDDLGLGAAIEWQAREFESRSGVAVHVDAPQDLALDRDRATAIFRIFQEILTNVGRHSGARTVAARLWTERGRVRLRVRDDGRGIRPEEAVNLRSFGLLGMRERASLLGGSFRIEAGEAGGTIVTVALPLDAEGAS